MRAIGYMYKRVETPEGFDLPGISDVYSLGACVNDDFADYIDFWKHKRLLPVRFPCGHARAGR